MALKTWGPDIWEQKGQAHDAVGVIMGTGSSVQAMNANTKATLDLMQAHFLSKLPKAASLLDVGVGPAARISIPLASQGYQMTGLDGSPTTLANAGGVLASSGQSMQFAQADFTDFNLNKQFDGLFCIETFYHLPAHLSLLAMTCFNKHLKPGGLALVQFSVMNELTPGFLFYNFLYMSAFRVLRKFKKKKAFYVTVTRNSEAEVEDLAKRAGFEVVWSENSYYLFKKA